MVRPDAAGGPRAIKLVLADDHAVLRAGLRALLEKETDLAIVGEAGTGNEALTVARSTRPHVVLMDRAMPGNGGIEATRRIKAAHPDVVVVLLSTYSEDDLPAGARTCGAAAYLNKERFGPTALRELAGENGLGS